MAKRYYHQNNKLSGILLESYTTENAHYVVIGFGINCQMPNDFAPNFHWVDLARILKTPINQTTLCAQIINEIICYLKDFEQFGFTHFLKQWQRYDYLFEQQVTIKEQTGIAQGINEQGALMLNINGNITPIYSNT